MTFLKVTSKGLSLEKVSLDDPEQLKILKTIYLSLDRDLEKLNDKFKGEEWIELGFQCDDPTTDFRGTGQLGLLNLHYFVTTEPDRAKEMMDEANKQEQHYFFSCAGINITHKLLFMLTEEKINLHIFENANDKEKAIHRFNMLYDQFFTRFHGHWVNSNLKTSIMNFNVVLNDFCEKYKERRV